MWAHKSSKLRYSVYIWLAKIPPSTLAGALVVLPGRSVHTDALSGKWAPPSNQPVCLAPLRIHANSNALSLPILILILNKVFGHCRSCSRVDSQSRSLQGYFSACSSVVLVPMRSCGNARVRDIASDFLSGRNGRHKYTICSFNVSFAD